jgi:hypothetical protein
MTDWEKWCAGRHKYGATDEAARHVLHPMRALRRVVALRTGSFLPPGGRFKLNRPRLWTFHHYSVTGRGKVAHV